MKKKNLESKISCQTPFNDRLSFLKLISPDIEMFIAISVVDPKGQYPQRVLKKPQDERKILLKMPRLRPFLEKHPE
jgi:hypothetical protein